MIARYIAELLLNHDCVIIPGFGGLMAQSAGASYIPEQKTLFPPSRKLLFNNQLVINDGLLVNCISRKEKISFAEASMQLMKWTDEIKSSVSTGNRYMVEGIGSFYLNHEKKLQFTPENQSNFLLSSYGLKPVVVTTSAKRKPKPVKIGNKTVPAEKGKAAGFVSLAAAIALLIASVLMFPKFEMNLASLAGLWSLQDYIPKENVSVKQPEVVVQSSPEEITASSAVEENVEAITEINETAPGQETVSSSAPVSEPEHSVTTPAEAIGNYHVIAGCFRIEENAFKLTEELKVQGLQAAIIGKTKSGLTMVSAGRFPSAVEANEKLADMKALLPDGGWVFYQTTKE